MKIKAIITLYASGKEIIPGTIVDIADGEAQRLIERGFAAENKTQKTSPAHLFFHVSCSMFQVSSFKIRRDSSRL